MYDPAFVHVGDNCGDSDGNAKNEPEQRGRPHGRADPRLFRRDHPGDEIRVVGFQRLLQRRQLLRRRQQHSEPVDGVDRSAPPDLSTWDPTNNPVVCSSEFPGIYPETGNDQPTGTVDATRFTTLLQQSTTYPGTNPG